jgi:pseudouridine 5'-phosphatase
MVVLNKLMKITSIIYDCDGVLLDTEPIYTEAANKVLEEFNQTLPLKLKLALLGQSGDNVANSMVTNLHLPITPQQYKERAKREEQSRFPNCKIVKGAEEAVSLISKNQIPLAIATSSISASFAIKTRGKDELFSHFKVITKGDQVRRPKPDPEIFQTTFTKLKEMHPELLAEECLVIEDSPSGIRGALGAGMKCFWLLDSIYEPEWYDQFEDLLHVPRFKSHFGIIDKLEQCQIIKRIL